MTFDHAFSERPILPINRNEVASLATEETAAGIPLRNSLRRSGWSEEALEELEEDRQSEQAGQSAALARAILESRSGRDATELEA